MKSSKLLALAMVLATQSWVLAQTNQPIDTIAIDEVVVTGTKVQVSRNQVPLSISVVDAKMVEQSAESALLPILSKEVPGLFVTERGVTGFGVARGAAGQISIRGVGAQPTTQVLVLLNGNPQYMGIMGHPMSDAYRASNIERVEVVRGPASTLYGSNAMGGVINIITKEQNTQGYSINADASAGSYNTFKMAAGGGFNKSKFNMYAGINHDQSDGHRPASYFNITDSYFKAGYHFSSHWNILADASIAQYNGADPGKDSTNLTEYNQPTVGAVSGDTADILRGMGALTLNNRYQKMDGSFRFFYNFGDHSMSDGFKSDDYNYGLVLYENFNLFPDNTITLGFDHKTLGGKAENVKTNKQFADTLQYETALYAMVNQTLFKKLTLNAGLRAETSSANELHWVPTIGAIYSPIPQTALRASYSKGFRNPSIRELYITFPFQPLPNANLLPETMDNYEIGIEQSFMKNAIKTGLTLYYLDGTNLIQPYRLPSNQMRYENIAEVTNKGIEFSFKHALNKWLRYHANYSYLDMKTPVIGAPEQKLYASVNVMPGKFMGEVSYEYIHNLYLATGTTEITESYGLLNLQLAYRLFSTTTSYVKIENLLNTDYTVNLGYPMPGITVMAGLRFNMNH